ncbi:uncharacterized protein LOC136019249 isoform X2 [Lathamus discolor]|uniref:uncharacterized protein LOC136019249 isoform X2 n=1 Tax=Lathamus discolor TaxID=678569 RepID=UPI0032B7205E
MGKPNPLVPLARWKTTTDLSWRELLLTSRSSQEAPWSLSSRSSQAEPGPGSAHGGSPTDAAQQPHSRTTAQAAGEAPRQTNKRHSNTDAHFGTSQVTKGPGSSGQHSTSSLLQAISRAALGFGSLSDLFPNLASVWSVHVPANWHCSPRQAPAGQVQPWSSGTAQGQAPSPPAPTPCSTSTCSETLLALLTRCLGSAVYGGCSSLHAWAGTEQSAGTKSALKPRLQQACPELHLEQPLPALSGALPGLDLQLLINHCTRFRWRQSTGEAGTVAIYGGEELSCAPLPESQAPLPSGTKARMCFACRRPRQARAMRVWFGFPVKKEAASPTSGLVRSSES